jgi:hypothetical protein
MLAEVESIRLDPEIEACTNKLVGFLLAASVNIDQTPLLDLDVLTSELLQTPLDESAQIGV